MKVLFIGCYRDGTGWAQAAIDYILAADSAGVDIVCRPVKLNDSTAEIPNRIVELEKKPLSGCDVCIQHVLPHLMDYNGRFKKNIGLYASETSTMKYSSWPQKINRMDEAWVINSQMSDCATESDVSVPVKIIPHASDTSKFKRSHKKINLPTKGEFIFYFIGELIRRKNLVSLLKAFHLEFTTNEPVSLLIKTSKYGLSDDECAENVVGMCNAVKENLKLYSSIDDYKQEIIVTERLSDEDIINLHNTCDCFVMPSFGEAWCIPAFDAMGFGKTPICTNTGGMADFLSDGGGILVEGYPEPVFGMTETFHDIYTGHEDWINVDIRGLQKAMRKIYTMHTDKDPDYKKMKEQGLKSACKYSYENIGKLMEKEISDVK